MEQHWGPFESTAKRRRQYWCFLRARLTGRQESVSIKCKHGVLSPNCRETTELPSDHGSISDQDKSEQEQESYSGPGKSRRILNGMSSLTLYNSVCDSEPNSRPYRQYLL